MGDTAISWTHRPGTRGRSWNPIKGCSRVSEGCRHCYAERQAARIVRMQGESSVYAPLIRTVRRMGAYGEEVVDLWAGKAILDSKTLVQPLRWRAPSTVFANSMSDMFHESLTNEQIAAVFGVMAACQQHTFIVLTKRAKRMRKWFAWAVVFMQQCARNYGADIPLHLIDGMYKAWPLSNVWIGVSVENQAAADERIPDLLATPAAVRLLSCEPLLGPVDLRTVQHDREFEVNALTGDHGVNRPLEGRAPGINWVIAGCESGPDARPCDVVWLRSLRDQCKESSVPFYLKQANSRDWVPMIEHGPCAWYPTKGPITAGMDSYRKAGGVIECPYLDGVQHRAFPVGPE